MYNMRLFELRESLRPGSSAKAVLLKWNGERYARTNQEIVVHDFVDTHGDKGDRGYGFLWWTPGGPGNIIRSMEEM